MASIASEEIFESPGLGTAGVSSASGTSAVESASRILGKNDVTAGDGLDIDSISAQNGFEYFRGKVYLDAKQTQIYSVADAIEKRVEAPKQRLARLHQELAEFAADLAKMNEVSGANTDDFTPRYKLPYCCIFRLTTTLKRRFGVYYSRKLVN
jgi:hypothetical protein